MASRVFRKRFEFSDAPENWRPVNAALDWSGSPLLLMVEGKGDSPSFRTDPEAWSRWYRTPPKTHHVIYWDDETMETLRLEGSQGISSFHIQRFQDGWLLGERRGGRALVYDRHGRLLRTLDLGDASEDLQTTQDERSGLATSTKVFLGTDWVLRAPFASTAADCLFSDSRSLRRSLDFPLFTIAMP
jgi:hypothetical protein